MIRQNVSADLSEEYISESSGNDDELTLEEVLALEAT
jgi:hypothetical protein